jgi:S1-C subfamily serine protease/regulator of sirC expression with transglutaminase-like and TPR domain
VKIQFAIQVFLALALSGPAVRGQDAEAGLPAGPGLGLPFAGKTAESVEALVASVRRSVVVINSTGRDGRREGIGAGFLVSADGLIVTNLHVTGEARPIGVQLFNGDRYEAVAVHAFDRAQDLAVIKIDAENLPALPLGDSDALKQGRPVIAIGNPLGLQHSVVSGLVSSIRNVDGRPMIQLAMPVEPGNSGGPLMDLEGRVQGILTLKGLVTANLGFAVPINALKPLLDRPNPVPMARWMKIGALDADAWTPVFGGRWRQRAGRIVVDGWGLSFGGRALCLSKQPVSEIPYEIAVQVRLDDESGAAGLVFSSDGGDKHYGFYPSGGRLRFTRFGGPDLQSWDIMYQQDTVHYRQGDWNTLKVRREADRFLCYVNGKLIVETSEVSLGEGKVGLAKFRDTRAEFKKFEIGKDLGSDQLAEERVKAIRVILDEVSVGELENAGLVDRLVPDAAASVTVLRDRARTLQQEASALRDLADAVHEKKMLAELAEATAGPDAGIDLARAAMLIAKLDGADVDVDAYLAEIDGMAAEISAGLAEDADDDARLTALNHYLFVENGFHGSRLDYDNKVNSYLNQVIDDREGLPITLSVLYMEVGNRIGLKLVGVGLPGHFVVRQESAEGEGRLIDVFANGERMSRRDADQRVRAAAGRRMVDSDLAASTHREILTRMVRNLFGLAQQEGNAESTLRYLDAALTISPDNLQERWNRAYWRYRTGNRVGAIEDIDWMIKHQPEGFGLDQVMEFRRLLQSEE